jgi:hypothetical protein
MQDRFQYIYKNIRISTVEAIHAIDVWIYAYNISIYYKILIKSMNFSVCY